MVRGFLYIFWGFLITIFDFRILGFNLIPDFVGFMLIATGLTDLEESHPNFTKARFLVLVLVFITLPEIIEFRIPVQPGNPTITINLIWPLILIGNVTTVVMTWFLLKGIIELAQKFGPTQLAYETPFILNFYLGVEIFSLSFGLTFHLFGAWLFSIITFIVIFLPLTIILITMSFLLSLLILNVYYKASKEMDV